MKEIKVSILIGVLACIMVVSACGDNNLKSAVFTNLKPSVTFNNREYIVTEKIVKEGDIGKQIAKVTKINNIVSYSDENNPYKEIGEIFKIANEDINKKIAIEINKLFFMAEIDIKCEE